MLSQTKSQSFQSLISVQMRYDNQMLQTYIASTYLVMADQSTEGQTIMGVDTPQGYVLYLEVQQHFLEEIQIFQTLYTELPPKATPEQIVLYQQYLQVRDDTIRNQVFPGLIRGFEDLEQRIEYYNTTLNPKGFQLYVDRYEHLCRVTLGIHSKDWKKWKKQNNWSMKKTLPVQPKKVFEQKEEKKEQVRKEDPKIDLQKLSTTEWNRATYPKYEDLRKPNVNIVFIGHVDAGKSTLSGRILVNLKLVDEVEYKKLEQEAKTLHRPGWELSFVTSNIQLEKDRGKTIECSKTLFALPNRRYTLFDAPGHANYVPNMIMGACQADLAVLILSSKEGEFESGFEKEGQTKEHALLAKALGVTTLICVVTKMGLSKWSKERYEFIKNSIVPYLKNTCKYPRVEILPIDSVDNINIDARIPKEVCDWYNGPSVLEILNDIEVAPKNPMGPLRIPIVDKMKDQGQLYVYGKVESGTIIQDQEVTLLPSKQSFEIKEIYDPSDIRIPYAPAGENVKIKVKYIEEDDILRGNIICNNGNFNQVCNVFQARLHVLDLPETKKLISPGSQAVIHLHSSVENIQIEEVEAVENPETGKMVKTTFLRANQVGIVKIKSQNELCLEKHDFMPELGRFTLRDQGKTIAYGEILKFKSSQAMTTEQKAQLKKTEGEVKTETVKESVPEKLSKTEQSPVA